MDTTIKVTPETKEKLGELFPTYSNNQKIQMLIRFYEVNQKC